MTRPAPYPNTDAAEQDAVNVFKSLIDTKLVKDDIRTRDKYPNIDGTVELVDKEGHPVGKFDIQIRKIPKNAVRYSCPMTLVEYSKVSTLPIILVCVDTDNRKAYWKAILPTIPEIKEGQDTFTIQFDQFSDVIADNGNYLRLWRELVEDYKQRIERYPFLKKEVINKLTVESISRDDKVYFQRYVDRINLLLDNDFIAVKKILFPDVWKLGVGIYNADERSVRYQIYKVPFGVTEPLICALEGNPFDIFHGDNPNTFSIHGTTRQYLGEPDNAGNKFVLDHVKKILQKRRFAIHGELIATEVIFSFVDRYSHVLGLSPNQPAYSLAEVNKGLYEFLPGILAHYLEDNPTASPKPIVYFDFENISRYLRGTLLKPVPIEKIKEEIVIDSQSSLLPSASESIRYLLANNVYGIKRPYKPATIPPTYEDGWIWSRHSTEDEEHNILKILRSSIDEYSAFVRGNQLKLPNSYYLDRNTSIILSYEPSKRGGFRNCPILSEYLVDNSTGCLDKLTITFGTTQNQRIDSRDFGFIRIDGKRFACKSSSTSNASFLFQHTPMLNMIYRMLNKDLSRHYGISYTSVEYSE